MSDKLRRHRNRRRARGFDGSGGARAKRPPRDFAREGEISPLSHRRVAAALRVLYAGAHRHAGENEGVPFHQEIQRAVRGHQRPRVPALLFFSTSGSRGGRHLAGAAQRVRQSAAQQCARKRRAGDRSRSRSGSDSRQWRGHRSESRGQATAGRGNFMRR